MSEFKGTKGPWSFEHNSASDEVTFCINVVAGEVSDICYLQSNEEYLPSWVHTVANANLIAAAPELLEALQEVVKAMRQYEMDVGESAPYKHRMMMEKAELALSKALGQ